MNTSQPKRIRAPQDRSKYREKDRAYEARRRDRGDRMLTVRICAKARNRIVELCQQYQCTTSELISALLLGNLPAPNLHRLSPSEIEYARTLGIRL